MGERAPDRAGHRSTMAESALRVASGQDATDATDRVDRLAAILARGDARDRAAEVRDAAARMRAEQGRSDRRVDQQDREQAGIDRFWAAADREAAAIDRADPVEARPPIRDNMATATVAYDHVALLCLDGLATERWVVHKVEELYVQSGCYSDLLSLPLGAVYGLADEWEGGWGRSPQVLATAVRAACMAQIGRA